MAEKKKTKKPTIDPAVQEKEARRKRRRERLDQRISKRTMAIFLVFWLLISVFLLIFPRSTVSNIEKRELTKWPSFSLSSYFSGEYTAGITEFYDDTVPFRDFFKNINNNIKAKFGISAGTAEVIGNVQKISEVEESGALEAVAVTSEGEELAPSDGQSKSDADETKAVADGELNNGFLIVNYNGHWRGLSLFGGGTGDAYVENVNALNRAVGDDVTVYAMPVPLASAFYLPQNYTDYSADQTQFINNVLGRMDDGVVRLNIMDILSEHQDEDIFLRTDHHWSALGAYYAAKVYAEAAGVPFPELDSSAYEEGVNTGYVGSLYGYTQSSNLLNDPEDFVYYVPTAEYTADFYDTSFQYIYTGTLMMATDTDNSYMMFTGSDDQIVKVTTDANNDRKMIIIKDSYGNAEVPYFTSSFEEIYVIDMRYFDLNLIDFIEQMGITDVLFSFNLASVSGNSETISGLMTQYKGLTITDEAPVSKYADKKTTQSSTQTSGSENTEDDDTDSTAADNAAAES